MTGQNFSLLTYDGNNYLHRFQIRVFVVSVTAINRYLNHHKVSYLLVNPLESD